MSLSTRPGEYILQSKSKRLCSFSSLLGKSKKLPSLLIHRYRTLGRSHYYSEELEPRECRSHETRISSSSNERISVNGGQKLDSSTGYSNIASTGNHETVELYSDTYIKFTGKNVKPRAVERSKMTTRYSKAAMLPTKISSALGVHAAGRLLR